MNFVLPFSFEIKFSTGVHCRFSIMILTFIFSIYYPCKFWGQTSSQSLKFSKWTKYMTMVHCYMFIAILAFIFSIFFFIQFCWEYLIFSKWIGIWRWNTLLYVDNDFEIFSNIFFIWFFEGKFDPKISYSPNWPKFTKGVHFQEHL